LEILRKLRWVLYPSVFILVFLIGSYCSFPKSVLRAVAETSITQAAMSFVSPMRGMPKVAIKDISLWRLSGMDLKDVAISWEGFKREPPMSFVFDRLKARMGIFSLLSGSRSISTNMLLYGGSLSADVKINKQKLLTNLYINSSKLDLNKADFIQSALGAPLAGILDLAVNLSAASSLSKDGNGNINIILNQGVFGPGSLNLPRGGMVPALSLPQVNLGTFTANLDLDKGQLESKTITLSGGDLEADLKLSITLGRIPALSRLNGRGWFSLKKEFINANETIKMLYDLIPELRTAKNGDGRVGFSLSGTLGRPMPKLEMAPPPAENAGASNKTKQPSAG